ncbi:MAG: hydrolase, alpha/beta fold family protein [Ilumatobacteraceae bacterium]|nr:hydrolase, alpha/beta fold family protein [Ilumatobacteraceae bacterium]
MATYVLIPGAGSDAWNWHLVVALLRQLGHRAIATDLPCGDDDAGFAEYRDAVLRTVRDQVTGDEPGEVVVVGHSLGGFTAPLVCEPLGAALLVFVAAMVPRIGERPGDWWTNTGHHAAHVENLRRAGRDPDAPFDPIWEFFHDVPAQIVAEALARGEGQQSSAPFERPYPLEAWPDVPSRFLLCRNDRFFPAEFLRGVAEDRLGIRPDELASGHLPMLAHPHELVAQLETYRTALG